ncbi:MAG TPA: trypsin-like peptidase domain-containing protein [Ktedonobacterales bacterium]|nr:trypsin-like peptidase domain-containing protein [Ktedonobacterales bacterium]
MNMQRNPAPGRAHAHATRRPRLARAFVALCAAAAVAWCVVALAPGAAQAAPRARNDGRPPGGNIQNPAVREVDIAEPATVRIGTEEHATLSLKLCSTSVTLPVAGGSYDLAGTGSGAFISANGDILTADHVVHVPDDEVALFAAQDIADVLNHAGTYDPGCAATVPVTATDIINGNFPINFTAHVLDSRTIVWQSTAFTGKPPSNVIKEATNFPATLVTSSSFTAMDIAIIHVNLTDTPSIALGDSDQVGVEDPLTVIGFPGNGDVNDNAINFLTPSVNNVNVSAVKVSDDNSQLLQVGGNVEHGDSGGPVLDANGHVVGIVSFAGPDTPGDTSFLRTSNNALLLARDKSLNLAPGQFQTRWAHAFDEYASTAKGHWHQAAKELDALALADPNFKAIAAYQNYAHTAAATEVLPVKPAPGPDPRLILAAAAGGGVLLLLLLVLLIVLLARRRQRRKLVRAAATIPPAMPGGAMPEAVAPQPGWPPAPYPGAMPPAGDPGVPVGSSAPGGWSSYTPGYPPGGAQGPYRGMYTPTPAPAEQAPSGDGPTTPPERTW